jgi:hypothetical protein
MMMAVFAAAQPQPTLSKSHGYRGFSISGLPGLTQRGTRHLLLNAHVTGKVLVSRQIAIAFSESLPSLPRWRSHARQPILTSESFWRGQDMLYSRPNYALFHNNNSKDLR